MKNNCIKYLGILSLFFCSIANAETPSQEKQMIVDCRNSIQSLGIASANSPIIKVLGEEIVKEGKDSSMVRVKITLNEKEMNYNCGFRKQKNKWILVTESSSSH